MACYVALLYSVVLAPGRRVLMEDFRAVARGLNYADPRTVAATGNLVFDAEAAPLDTLEQALEARFAAAMGRRIDIIVRPAEAWHRLVAANPFPRQTVDDPSHVAVRVMRAPITSEAAALLDSKRSPHETIAIVDGDPWFYFSKGIGQSKLAGVLTPKRIGVGTARNVNTVRAIDALIAKG